MFDFVLTPEMSKELLNYQGELLNKVISSIKKYFSENDDPAFPPHRGDRFVEPQTKCFYMHVP